MIVSDSTTLIILLDLGRLDLLNNLFPKVYVPQTVYEEVTYKNNNPLPSFMQVITVDNSEQLDELLLLLDRGESEAIILAKQRQLPLIIDEKKGRKIAITLQIKIIGLLGIVFLNIKNNYLKRNEAEQFLNAAKAQGYRISEKLITDMFSQL